MLLLYGCKLQVACHRMSTRHMRMPECENCIIPLKYLRHDRSEATQPWTGLASYIDSYVTVLGEYGFSYVKGLQSFTSESK